MSWVQAVRIYLASPPHLRHRDSARLFERVARAHLRGPPGHTIHVHCLSLLRQVRWEILKSGTPQQKARALEAILACYANARNTYAYDPMRSENENHVLGLEQLQCLVEARLVGIPLQASHYRFLLQLPQLSQLGPSTPLLLLREIERAGETITDRTRLNVGVGLAAMGRWEEALELSPRAHFLELIERVAATQRHGWRPACILASHIGNEVVMQDEIALTGLMSAFALRLAAAWDMIIWKQMTELLTAYSLRHGSRPPPRRAIDFLIDSCPPEQWCVAARLVATHNSRANDREKIPIGRVMGLLNEALQWERVLLLYQATPSVLPPNERGHSAVHNHAFVALARGGMWQQAIRFHAEHPVKNVHTHLSWLKMVLLEQRIPFSSTWISCIEAYSRSTSYNHRFTETLVHAMAAMGDWVTALNIARAVSNRTPRVLLITMSAAAIALKEEAVWQVAVELVSSYHSVSVRQICTAAAIVSCCTKGAPCTVSNALADALHRRIKNQQQFDDAACHIGRYMALLLSDAPRDEASLELPPAIDLLVSRKQPWKASSCWVFSLAILQAMSVKGWSLATVAPGMLSSGLDAAVAIHFLPI